MRRRRATIAIAAMGAVSLIVPAGAAQADRTATAEASTAPAARGDGDEYVVSLAGDATTAVATLQATGAEVLDVNAELGIALVGATSPSFLADATATGAITGGARNHSVGMERRGQPHRFAEERPYAVDAEGKRTGGDYQRSGAGRPGGGRTDPLASLQWDMDLIDAPEAQRRATGRGVTVGIIDTGVDASHPDIAPNFDHELSRNFTMDIPEIDGPCEMATCIDPVDTDDGGHGTHVAGTVAAARNGVGITGVAPDATIVNVRAGQDSGYFFVYETVAALTYAGDAGLDVVNMSFYTDPWLFNCASRDDYVSGEVTDEQIAEQAFVRSVVLAATAYAHERGVTMVAAAGNDFTDLAAPTRADSSSPDYGAPPSDRVVTNNCLDLPAEAPDVITVGSVGPSTTKAYYSNWGLGTIDVSAPGGWFRDYPGTEQTRLPGNLILSAYPLHVAIEEGLADENGVPVDDFSMVSCDRKGNNCGFYTYLQGTSMAAPHVAGLAALIIQRHGHGNPHHGYSLDPDTVASIIERSATDNACPASGVISYPEEIPDVRPAYDAPCTGTTADNGLYGEGIINAERAVAKH
jgi:subtilisin family serine protease